MPGRLTLRKRLSGRAGWDARASRHGLRAALNLRHAPTDLDRVTEQQSRTVLPYLERALAETDPVPGRPMTVLDFGCGWGRWCERLADVTGGTVLGVDPTRYFIDEARRRNRNEAIVFRLLADRALPVDDASIDVVWAFGVLNAILDDRALALTANELGRVTRPGGLLFVVDITTTPPSRGQRTTVLSVLRAPEDYRQAFSNWVDLEVVGAYVELDETNEIMRGRKRA